MKHNTTMSHINIIIEKDTTSYLRLTTTSFLHVNQVLLSCTALRVNELSMPCKTNKDGSLHHDSYRPAPSKPVSHPPRSYAAKPSKQIFSFFNLYLRDKLPRRFFFSLFIVTSHTTPSLRTIPFVISTPRCITPCIWFWF